MWCHRIIYVYENRFIMAPSSHTPETITTPNDNTTMKPIMQCALALLLNFYAATVLAVDYPIEPTCSTDSTDFVSYYTHVLFWSNNEAHTNGALDLRDAFIHAHDLGNNAQLTAPWVPAIPLPTNSPMCVFGAQHQV